MAIQSALNEDLRESEGQAYDEDLHRRFVLYKDQGRKSVQAIARSMNRSTAAISQYINKKYPGDVAALEVSILNLLQRDEDLEFVTGPKLFCGTKASTLIWEVMQYCDKHQKMGVVLAPSGTGKTETCKEYKEKNRATVFVTADISTRRVGAILGRISAHAGVVSKKFSISDMLHYLIDKLRDSNRLIIIDDAHFLTWEAFEAVRKIHDCARVGVTYVGQERLYDQMRGANDKNYLFDQIYSRIAIKRDKFQVLKKDAQIIADSICPGMDKACIDFLYAKARGKGRLRVMANVLEVAMEIRDQFGKPMGVELLMEAERFLMI